jgi:hypothetical protein
MPSPSSLTVTTASRLPPDWYAGVDLSDPTAHGVRHQQVKREHGIPDTCHAVDIAGLISVDPGSLGPHTGVEGSGVLALTACGREHGHPRGALTI